MDGNYEDAREWMALSVAPLHAAANELVRSLVRRGEADVDRTVAYAHLGNAMKQLHEAQENLMRARIVLEKR